MKNIILLISLSLLTACSFSGFKPPSSTNYWTSDKYYKSMDFVDYILFQNKELRECGIDPFANQDTGGSTVYALCMEKKGWVNTAGPTCERDVYKDNPACDDWRSKHSKSLI